MSKIIDNWFAEIDKAIAEGKLRMVFWTCPDPRHRMVTWSHDGDLSTPTCDECGRQGEPR